jgi:chromosome segregation ATPase
MNEDFGERISVLETDMETLKKASERNDHEHESLRGAIDSVDLKVTSGEKSMIKLEEMLKTVITKLEEKKTGKITAVQVVATVVMIIFGAISAYATIRGIK